MKKLKIKMKTVYEIFGTISRVTKFISKEVPGKSEAEGNSD